MNTPNPLVPQGSLQEQAGGKSRIRIYVFTILAIHLAVLGAFLIQGCKPDNTAGTGNTATTGTESTNPPPVNNDFNPQTNAVANTTPPPPPPPTNIVIPPPPATSVVEVPPTGAESEHVVAKGESFSTIGTKYGVSARAIAAANPGVDSTKLQIKQKLKIPAKPVPAAVAVPGIATDAIPAVGGEKLYVVKSGDTLTGIAKAHHTSVKAIQAANNLKTTQIRVDQKLKLPIAVAPVSAPAPTATPTPGGPLAPAPGTPQI